MTPTKPDLPLRLFAFAFAFSALTILLVAALSWRMHLRADELAERHIALTQSIGRIRLLDEVLTMSAGMAATTGDMSYEQRYDRFDPPLRMEIDTVRTLLPQVEFGKFIEETDAANAALVTMERQAFALTHQGKGREALALLASAEYARLKTTYADGADNITGAVNVLMEDEDRWQHRLVIGLALLSAVAAALLLAAWVCALRAARRWQAEREQALLSLEARIAERTGELQSEMALHVAAATKFRKITESTQDAIIMMEADKCISFWNPAAERIFGYASEEALGKEMHPLIAPPEACAGFELGFQHFLRSGTGPVIGKTLELTALRKGGVAFPVEVTLSALELDGSWKAIGIFRDISERKRNEQGLARLQRSQEHILNSVGEGIHGIDLDGNVTFQNPAGEAMLGWSRQELIGHHTHSTVHHSHEDGSPYPASECRIYATLHDGVTRHIDDEVFWRKDGTSFPVAYTSTPMRNEVGEIVGATVSFRDITERRQHEQALAAAHDAIVRKNAQLLESNRARSEFLAAMSHGLKTPLNHIIGFSELLAAGVAGPLTEKQRGFAQDIYEAGSTLLGLLSDILDLARLEDGHARLELNAVGVDGWLTECVLPWRERASASGLRFTLDIPEPLGTLYLDAVKARQIVVSLLSNAVKFTPNGGAVTFTARRAAQAQARLAGDILPDGFAAYLEIEVRDTGIGFSPEMLHRLFEPFHQDDAALARRYAGVGLGLAMVKRLVDLHGGAVQAYNAPDHGACVTVWLPWREHAADRGDATSCSGTARPGTRKKS